MRCVAQRTYGGKTGDERLAERRDRLLAAGLERFGTEGVDGATITALCREAGVTARHFYEHFASVEELLLAVYEHVLDRHRGAVVAALADAPEDDLRARVRAAVGAAIAAWTQDRQMTRVAFLEVVGRTSRVEARRQAAIAEYTALVVAVADDLHARGLVPAPGRPLAARAVVGALIGLVEAWFVADDPPSAEALTAEAEPLALAALAGPTPAG
jgi:AcrR family transcriptional regulator